MTLLVNILRRAGEKEGRTLNQCRLFMKWTHRNLFRRLFLDSWWVVSCKDILQCRCTLCLVIMTLKYLNYKLCRFLINREDKTHSSSASLFNHQWKYSLITIKTNVIWIHSAIKTFPLHTVLIIGAIDDKYIITSCRFIHPFKLRGNSFFEVYLRLDWNRNIQFIKKNTDQTFQVTSHKHVSNKQENWQWIWIKVAHKM